MDYYLSDAVSGARSLVYFSVWTHRECTYWVTLYHASGDFFFQGRERVSGGRHVYIPDERWHLKNIGGKEKAQEFLRSVASAYGCPTEELEEGLSRIGSAHEITDGEKQGSNRKNVKVGT